MHFLSPEYAGFFISAVRSSVLYFSLLDLCTETGCSCTDAQESCTDGQLETVTQNDSLCYEISMEDKFNINCIIHVGTIALYVSCKSNIVREYTIL